MKFRLEEQPDGTLRCGSCGQGPLNGQQNPLTLEMVPLEKRGKDAPALRNNGFYQ